MSEIDKLKQAIIEIEDQAGQMDPTDYEGLYKLLATAYFMAKDIIAIPAPMVDTAELDSLKDVATSLRETNNELRLQIVSAHETIEAIKELIRNKG